MSLTDVTKIVLVGPTHPYTGGIAQHTTRLALELEARGLPVIVESWSAQYPKRLYPGPTRVPGNRPEVGIPSGIIEKLAWFNPLSWWIAGHRSRKGDRIAFNVPTPFHAIPYLVMINALRSTTRTIGIMHNVSPHEPKFLDKFLMRALLAKLDRIIVHGDRAAEAAHRLGCDRSRIDVLNLPSPWGPQNSVTSRPKPKDGPTRFLFFGKIRHYKGVDLLLDALQDVPAVTLTIAGEFWEEEASYLRLIDLLGLSTRVTVQSGYVAEKDFASLFGSHDMVLMPYRRGSGSIVRELAFQYGLPVIASDVGAISEGIEDDVNGLVIQPDDRGALVEALTRASDPVVLSKWKKGVTRNSSNQSELWLRYTQAILGEPSEPHSARVSR